MAILVGGVPAVASEVRGSRVGVAILLVQLLHRLCLDDGGGHLEIEGLEVADKVTDASSHHWIGCTEAKHRNWAHARIAEHIWEVRNRHRLLPWKHEVALMFLVLSVGLPLRYA